MSWRLLPGQRDGLKASGRVPVSEKGWRSCLLFLWGHLDSTLSPPDLSFLRLVVSEPSLERAAETGMHRAGVGPQSRERSPCWTHGSVHTHLSNHMSVPKQQCQ